MTQDSDHIPNHVFQTYLKTHHHLSLDKIAVAVSGGPDSMALADIVAHNFDGAVYMLTVDHQLREGSEDEARNVAKWVVSLNKKEVTHHLLRWDHDHPDSAIMEKARDARYELMQDFCDQYNISLLLTAHHQDDQAETFLLRLMKGSGVDGLSAMDAERALSDTVTLGRPFLTVSKNDLIAHCDQHNIPYVTDPSNENDQYQRPRLRSFIAGMVKEGMDQTLLPRTAARLGRAKAALHFYQDQAYQKLVTEEKGCFSINYAEWCALPDEIGLRVLQHIFEQERDNQAYPVRMTKLEDLFTMLKKQPENYTDRTLGGYIIRLKDYVKDYVKDNETKIVIEKET